MKYFIRIRNNFNTIEEAEEILKYRNTISSSELKIDFYPRKQIYKKWVPVIVMKIIDFIFFM